ncbi:KRAB [Lepeophtheirus salmonis]|uniref:KRAB n=1 Tax=Lepeophtheirus salmonis TaxID=72036 RepID=A0A7R8CF65_LEPSM|nr:KRAB [Lepeophtheirus salmonis]CAF2763530.1 KRAB [Lepeophtheirus salmonis]
MERVFQCPQCEKGFKELRTLRLHLKIHNAEYPERCLVCQKNVLLRVKTKQQLNEHRRKHSGEKAYCCALCGTRFTYRNGLIKHTKLNRCPKKIITADGETIIKKRSRVVNNAYTASTSSPLLHSSPPSLTVTPVLNLQMSVAVAEAVNNVISATKGNKEALDKKIMEVLRRNSNTHNVAPSSSSALTMTSHKYTSSRMTPERILPDPTPPPGNRGSPIIDYQMQVEDIIGTDSESIANPIAYREVGNSFNLALLDDGSNCLVSTTCTLPTQTITTKAHPSCASSMTTTTTSSTVIAHNGILPPNTINELSAATGLPSSEICSWAATLPTGALQHQQQPSHQLLLPAIINIPPFQTAHPEVPLTVSESEVSGALKNSSVGLLSYREIFAVDPNEVLQKSQSKSSLLAQKGCDIKVEPNTTMCRENSKPIPSVNNNDTCLEDFIGFDYGIFESGSEGSDSQKPSIKEEPSSPTGSDSGLSNNSSFYSNSYYINNNEDTLADIDLGLPDCLNSNAANPLDDTLNVLNDQDFNSMKTIVEQTFKDGREIMDVI